MRNPHRRLLPAILSALLVLAMLPQAALALPSAESDFLYTQSGGEVTITGYKGPGGVVTFPSSIGGNPVVAIGSYISPNNYSITKVIIPGSVRRIGHEAFFGCGAITSVSLAEGLVNIEGSAFSSCNIASIALPSTVSTIGPFAFNTGSLVSISVASANPTFSSLSGVLYDKGRKTLLLYPQGKSGSFTIPSSVTRIETYAFHGATELTSLTIPNTVTSIGSNAFTGCYGLASLSIPASVTSIEDEAFQGMHLKSITVHSSNPAYCSVSGVLYNKTRTTLMYCPQQTTGAFTVPAGVTRIAKSAFANTGITGITLPNGLKYIGEMAFWECDYTTITIPASVTGIGLEAFSVCRKLKSILVSASNPTFCSLNGILYDKGKTKLIRCPEAYGGTLTVPSGVKEICYRAVDSTAINAVKLPASVAIIGDSAFIGCRSLTSVTLGSGLETIAQCAFEYCNLATVTIPAGVSSIGKEAFASNPMLAKAVFKGPMPATLGDDIFRSTKTGFKLYYHIANADSWSAWSQTAKQAFCNAKVTPNNGSKAKPLVLNVNGGHVAAPAAPAFQGHSFTGWYKDAACTKPWHFNTDVITGDIALYAGWTPPLTTGGMATVPPRVVWGK